MGHRKHQRDTVSETMFQYIFSRLLYPYTFISIYLPNIHTQFVLDILFYNLFCFHSIISWKLLHDEEYASSLHFLIATIFYISYFLAVVFYMKPSLLSDSRAWKPKFYKIIVTLTMCQHSYFLFCFLFFYYFNVKKNLCSLNCYYKPLWIKVHILKNSSALMYISNIAGNFIHYGSLVPASEI